MDWVAVGVIVTYLIGVTIAGSLLSKRNKNANDWAIASGGMGMLMIAVGVAGTRIGGAGTYGVAGNVMAGGVWSMWWYGISTFLAMALVGGFFAVSYRRLELHTVGEIFQKRFGTNRCQAVTSLCVQTEYLIVNMIEAYVIASILVGLAPQLPMSVAVSIAAATLITYVVLGGLWGTAVTNLIHCGVIIFGLAAVGVLGVNNLGGWETIRSTVDAHLAGAGKDQVVWWAFIGAGLGPVIGMIFSTAIHTPAASVYTNYASAAKSERIILPAFLLAGLIGALMPFLAGLIGILTLAEFGVDRGFSSYTNITAFAAGLNPLLGGIALAAVFAAVVSSGGPILLSSATMFVRDWMWFTRKYPDGEKLRLYRIATVLYGIFAAFLAWVWKTYPPGITVLDLLLFGFAMVVPPAIAVGYLIYWKGTTESGAYWGIWSGYITGLIWYLLIRIAVGIDFTVAEADPMWRQIFHYCFVHHGDGLDPSYVTTVVPLLAIPIVSKFTRREETPRDRAFYDCLAGNGRFVEP